MTTANNIDEKTDAFDYLDRSLGTDRINTFDSAIQTLHDSTGSYLELSKSKVYEDLSKAVLEAYSEGWDGYKALAANPNSIAYSLQFIGRLPDNIPNPEVAIDHDGEIALEWDYGPREILSLRIGRGGSIHFASLLGYDSSYGTVYFAENIPLDIKRKILSIAHTNHE